VSRAGGAPRFEVGVRLFQLAKRQWHEAEVGGDGTFQVGLPPDEYRLLVLDRSGHQRPPLASRVVRLEPGKTTRLEIPVDDSEPVESLTVQVLEPLGQPSPEATVWMALGGRPVRGYRTDETGRVSVAPMQGEGVTLRAFNGGRTGEVPHHGERGEVTIVLRPAAMLHGRVTGGGIPVAGFTLELEVTSRWHPSGPGALSFAGDEFLVADLPPEKVLVRVFTPDGRKGSAPVTLAPGATSEVTVALGEASQIRARVVDGAGQPLGGAVVRSVADGRELGRAGGDGRISVVWPAAGGSQRLRFEASGHAPAELHVDLESGQPLDLGDVTLASSGG